MTKHTVDANTQTSRQEIEGHFKGRQKLHKEKPNRDPKDSCSRMLKLKARARSHPTCIHSL